MRRSERLFLYSLAMSPTSQQTCGISLLARSIKSLLTLLACLWMMTWVIAPSPQTQSTLPALFMRLMTKLHRRTGWRWACSVGDWLWIRIRRGLGDSREGMEWIRRRSRGGRG